MIVVDTSALIAILDRAPDAALYAEATAEADSLISAATLLELHISDEAAALTASTLAADSVGWRMFQWLQRSLVPDRSVVD